MHPGFLSRCVVFLLGTAFAACGRESRVPTAPDPAGVITSPAQSLEFVSAPTSLLLQESALLTIRMRNPDGTEAQLPPDVQWKLSNETVARLQPAGTSGDRVITALRRGTVTLTVTAGSVATSAVLTVKARVGVLPDGGTPCEFPLTVCVAIGDRTTFRAVFVDVNGERLNDATVPASPTWTSSAPDVASMSVTAVGLGVVTGLRSGRATITASSSDGVGTLDVIVADEIQGGSALVRFAHVDDGRGPLTFVPSRGAPVTLAFGESTEVPIASGTYGVQVDGFGPIDWSGSWLVRDGDHLEVFATSWGLTAGWTSQASIPDDSGLIRFVQAGRTEVLLLGTPGATVAESRLVNCYFDPLAITQYVPVRSGELDVLGGGKDLVSGRVDSARERIRVTPGRAVTYAIIGDRLDPTMRVIAFPPF